MDKRLKHLRTLYENSSYKSGFGWITPRGTVIGTGMYNHIEALVTNSEAKEVWPEIESEWEEVKETEAECQSLEDREGHGEWHCYDMALDDFTYNFYTRLYNNGFVRYGKNSYNETIVFEGTEEALASHYRNMKNVVNGFNSENGTNYSLGKEIVDLEAGHYT